MTTPTPGAQPPFDPYDHLSVPRDADAAAIRRAYRRRAKSDHPDSPTGSREAFSRTARALAILSDPARRARFDATGDASDTTPDNRHAELAHLVMQLFDAVCAEEAKLGRSPLHFDVAQAMRELATKNVAAARRNRTTAEANLAAAEKLVGRFKRRISQAAPAGLDLDRLMQGRCDPFRQQIRQIDEAIAKFEEVEGMLADWTFAHDAPPPRQTQTFYVNTFELLQQGARP